MSDIVHRTVEKDEKLATLRDHRDHVNACKSLEKKLDLDLKREKVTHAVLCSHLFLPQTLQMLQRMTQMCRELRHALSAYTDAVSWHRLFAGPQVSPVID